VALHRTRKTGRALHGRTTKGSTMRRLALLAAALVAVPAAALDDLPPPPPPPGDDVPLPPPPPGTERRPSSSWSSSSSSSAPEETSGKSTSSRRDGEIGTGPITGAGGQVAPLLPNDHWSLGLASGIIGRFGGDQISSARENPSVLIYLGGQADGLWTEGYGRGVRLRLKLMTGGEDEIFIPSDGEVEAAFLIGRPEFRFVVGRLEVARYPDLALEGLGQFSTLPSVEGTLPLDGDRMRLSYFVAPVEMAWVYYYGDAHHSEANEPAAATAARLRYTVLLPPSVVFSLQGEVLKMWKKPDTMLGAEGSLGYQVLEKSVTFNVAVRWSSYTRRTEPTGDASDTASDLKLMAMATLVF
jgi:hypothetical protein